MRFIFCFLFSAFCYLNAQSLPEVTVTAAQLELKATDLPATLSTFNTEELERLQPKNIGELLAKSGLAFIREYGTAGLSNLSFRGSSANQTAILIDGNPLNDPQIGFLDLKLIPATLFKYVEVLHNGSALHGSDAVGGVISLRTLSPFSAQKEQFIEINNEVGAFNHRKIEGNYENSHSHKQARVFVSHQQNKGNFPYLNRTLIPAETQLRENADFRTSTLYGGFGRKFSNHTHLFSIWMTSADRGLATAIGSPASGERQTEASARFWYTGDFSTQNQHQINAKLMFYTNQMLYKHPQLEIKDLGQHWVLSGQIGIHQIRLKKAVGSLLSHAQVASAQHPSLPQNLKRQQLSLTNSWVVPYKLHRFFPALRFDTYHLTNNWIHSLNPSLGWNYRLSEPQFLKANLVRSFRMPTFNDLYWQPGGNPNLKPENAWSLSAGWGHQTDKKGIETALFARKTNNEIVWIQGTSFWSPQNIRNTFATGLEWQTYYQKNWSSWQWKTRFSGNILRALDLSDATTNAYKKQLRYIPRSQFGWLNTFQRHKTHLFLDFQFTGKRFTTTDESQFLPSIFTADFRFQQDFLFKHINGNIGFKLYNLFNQPYQMYQGYPMPLRHLNFTLNLLFK